MALMMPNDFHGKTDLLVNHYIDFNNYYDKWKENKKMKNFRFTQVDPSAFTRLQDSVMNSFFKEISKSLLDVDRLKPQLDIVQLKTTSTDELFSFYFTENLIHCVTNFYINLKTQRARETFNFLQKRADSTKIALDDAVIQLAKWQDSRNQLVKFEAQVDRAKLLRNMEILQALYTEILTNLETSKMNFLNIRPLITVIDKPVLPLDINLITMFIAVVAGLGGGLILTLLYLFVKMLIMEALHEDDEKKLLT